MKLNFLTSNAFKIATAKMVFEPVGIEVVPLSLPIPEIQADTNQEVARHSALEAAKEYGEPVMREDHGFFLDAFPGWPGPYMAHTERIILPEDMLRLLVGKKRTGYFEMALAYAWPSGDLVEYSFQLPCLVAEEIRPGGKDFGWDSILCLGDEERALSEYLQEERYAFFTQNFEQLVPHLPIN